MVTLYRHSEPEVCRELAEKFCAYPNLEKRYVYRFIDWHNEEGEPQIGLVAFPIRSFTPTGLTIPFHNKQGWKIIFDHMMSRAYARKTIQLALEDYINRKKFHVQYLEAKLRRTKTLHLMAQNKPEPLLNYETIDQFELSNESELIDH